jgi:hypothetical protein
MKWIKTVIFLLFSFSCVSLFSQSKHAPDFSLPDKDKNYVSLKNYSGKVVFLTFWGTGCTGENDYRNMKILHHKLKNYHDIVFVNIATKTNYERWLSLVSNGVPSGINLLGNDQIESQYHVSEWPCSFVIGKDGMILGENPDMIDYVLIRAREGVTARKAINEIKKNIRLEHKDGYVSKYLQERIKFEQDSTYSYSIN